MPQRIDSSRGDDGISIMSSAFKELTNSKEIAPKTVQQGG